MNRIRDFDVAVSFEMEGETYRPTRKSRPDFYPPWHRENFPLYELDLQARAMMQPGWSYTPAPCSEDGYMDAPLAPRRVETAITFAVRGPDAHAALSVIREEMEAELESTEKETALETLERLQERSDRHRDRLSRKIFPAFGGGFGRGLIRPPGMTKGAGVQW